MPMKVVQFGGSRQLERAIGGSSSDVDVLTNPSWSTRVASALLAGAVSGAVINPLDVCMTQQQKFGGSLGGVVSGLVRTHGPKVAFRGVRATMAREGLYACGYLCGAPWLRERAEPWVPEGAKRRGLDAFVAAAAAAEAFVDDAVVDDAASVDTSVCSERHTEWVWRSGLDVSECVDDWGWEDALAERKKRLLAEFVGDD